jgi:hypothetical protein
MTNTVRNPSRPVVDDDARVDLRQVGDPAGHVHDSLLARCRHLDALRSWPGRSLGTDCLDVLGRDEAAVDELELVRAMPVQPGPTGKVDAELHTGPPPQPVDVAWDRLDCDIPSDPGEVPQLLGDEFGLEEALSGQRDVLPVAAPTPAGTCIEAWGLDAVVRPSKDLDGVCA